jgi:hypothetical protein
LRGGRRDPAAPRPTAVFARNDTTSLLISAFGGAGPRCLRHRRRRLGMPAALHPPAFDHGALSPPAGQRAAAPGHLSGTSDLSRSWPPVIRESGRQPAAGPASIPRRFLKSTAETLDWNLTV